MDLVNNKLNLNYIHLIYFIQLSYLILVLIKSY